MTEALKSRVFNFANFHNLGGSKLREAGRSIRPVHWKFDGEVECQFLNASEQPLSFVFKCRELNSPKSSTKGDVLYETSACNNLRRVCEISWVE
jgi:hypothetical protein